MRPPAQGSIGREDRIPVVLEPFYPTRGVIDLLRCGAVQM